MAGAGAIKAGEAYIQIGARVDIDKDLKSMQTKLQRAGDKMLRVGRNFALAGAAIMAPLALATRASTRFGTGLANISTMLDKTSMEMLPRFSEGMKELAVAYGESTATLEKGLYDILSASVAAGSAMSVLEASAKAARAGISDTGTAADALTTILNSYKLSASEAGDVSDWFFGVVKRGKTTFAELGPSIGLVASDAAQAGLSLEEMGAALATMTRSGIRTEQAVTRLRAIINAFISPEKEAQKAAAKFGLELSANTFKTIGLRGVLQKLQGARIEDVAAIFRQVRALSGMNAMIGGTAGFLKDYDLLLNRTGATEEAFAKQTTALQFQLDQLKASVETLGITIGDQLTPATETGIRFIRSFITVTGALVKRLPILTKVAAGLATGLLAVGVATLGAGIATKVYAVSMGLASKAAAALSIKIHGLTAATLKYGAARGLLGGAVGIGAGLGTAAIIAGTIFGPGVHDAFKQLQQAREQLAQARLRLDDIQERVALRRIEKTKNAEINAARAVAAARKAAIASVVQKQKAGGMLTGIAAGGFPAFQLKGRRNVAGLAGVPMSIRGPKEELAVRKARVDKLKEELANRHKLMVLLNQSPTAADRKEIERHNKHLVQDAADLVFETKRYLEMVKAIETHLPGIKKQFPGLFPDREAPQRRQVTTGLENIRALSGATTAQLNRPGQGRMKMQGATETTQRQMARSMAIVARNTSPRGRGKILGIPTADLLSFMASAGAPSSTFQFYANGGPAN